jgi:hypothetical protein
MNKEGGSARAMKAAQAQREYMGEICRVHDGAIVIDVQRLMNDLHPDVSFGPNDYVIELGRCKDYGQVLGWTHHLCEKTWMSKPLLRRFVDVALEANSLKLLYA